MDHWKMLGALAGRLSVDYLRNSREAVGLWLAERIHQLRTEARSRRAEEDHHSSLQKREKARRRGQRGRRRARTFALGEGKGSKIHRIPRSIQIDQQTAPAAISNRQIFIKIIQSIQVAPSGERSASAGADKVFGNVWYWPLDSRPP